MEVKSHAPIAAPKSPVDIHSHGIKKASSAWKHEKFEIPIDHYSLGQQIRSFMLVLDILSTEFHFLIVIVRIYGLSYISLNSF